MKRRTKLTAAILAGIITATAFSAVPATAASSKAATVKKAKIKLAAISEGIKISWNKVKSAEKYVLQRKTGSAKSFSAIKTIRKTNGSKVLSFVDKKAKSGKSYTYRLKTVNGNASALSAEKTINYLAAPKNLKGRFINKAFDSCNKLTWSKVAGTEKYEVQCSVYKNKSLKAIKTVETVKLASFTDDGLSGGYATFYRVRAVKGKQKGAFTKELTMLYPIKALVKKNSSYTGLEVQWAATSEPLGFDIYRATGKSKSFKKIASQTSFKTKKIDGGLSGAQKVYYYNDKNVKEGEIYTYYVTGRLNKAKSPRFKNDTSTKRFDKFDDYIELGDTDESLSGQYTILKLQGASMAIVSSDEKIVSVSVTKNKDKTYNVILKGESEGFADVEITVIIEKQVITRTKHRIFVSAEPFYELTLKKGETDTVCAMDEIFSLYGTDLTDEIMSLNVTSSDSSVVRVNNPKSSKVSFTGVSKGEATINVVIKMPFLYGKDMVFLKGHFRIKVVD